MSTKTITTYYGETQRVSLPEPHFEKDGGPEDFTGVWIEALYTGPKTGRHFVKTNSIWDDGNGCNVGTRYRELDEQEYLEHCLMVGCEPVGVEPVQV